MSTFDTWKHVGIILHKLINEDLIARKEWEIHGYDNMPYCMAALGFKIYRVNNKYVQFEFAEEEWIIFRLKHR